MGIYEIVKKIKKKFDTNSMNCTNDNLNIKSNVEYAKNDYTEFDVCEYFINKLSKTKENSLFRIEQRSQNYLSLVYGNNDFLRIKYTENSKWISIGMYGDNRKENLDNPLFAEHKNKNQIHWKSKINTFEDLEKYLEIIEKACFVLKISGDEPLTEKEQEIADYIKEMFITYGAEDNKIRYRHLSNYAEIYYIGYLSAIKIKTYKTKTDCIFIDTRIAKQLKIKCGNDGKIEFSKLEELDSIKEYIKNRVSYMKNEGSYLEEYLDNTETGYENLRK